MTAPEDYHQTELPPDARRRLAEIAAEQSRLAAEAAALIAVLSGEPDRAADHVAGADHHVDDAMPSPGGLIALKSAAHIWGRSERNLKKIAADHGALHKVGGRNMVDDAKLTAAIFGRL